ncbi:uncharacterized protein LOC143239728 [Tachypleus tridentatus]|uniref:uncharacterized protein LOC143239728 n=1 Tax=Tachypleus tridentatus TaxID=6853 RepID=UPI003FD6A893
MCRFCYVCLDKVDKHQYNKHQKTSYCWKNIKKKSRSGMKFWRVLARVFVYIQTKKRIVYTSNLKYETQDVLRNLGGQFSLWLGISLTFTFKRTVQLMKDIFVKFWKGKRSLKVSPDPSSGSSKNVFDVQQTDVVFLTNTQLGLADIYHT